MQSARRTATARAQPRQATPTHTLQDRETRIIPDTPPTPPGFGRTPSATMTLSSGAFLPGGEIPVQYTCHGENSSPALDWSSVPPGTASLALTMMDPDSTPPGFVHWVVYNIPPDTMGLPPGVAPKGRLEDGMLQGTNSFRQYSETTFPSGAEIHKVGYDGPCPPSTHRYIFTLYALDITLDLGPRASLTQLTNAMQGHVLAQAQLQGQFTPPQ